MVKTKVVDTHIYPYELFTLITGFSIGDHTSDVIRMVPQNVARCVCRLKPVAAQHVRNMFFARANIYVSYRKKKKMIETKKTLQMSQGMLHNVMVTIK